MSRILLTGATGFVGGEVARRLVARGHSLACLVRPKEGQAPAARLAASGIVADVVEGEVGGPLKAVAREPWDIVIHCAGDTTFFPRDAEVYRRAHVDGAVDLLRKANAGVFLHVSTAFVCGMRTGRILESESDLDQSFHNPYEETKLEAELALRSLATPDLRIARPSIVVGEAPDTTGAGPTSAVYGFVRLVSQLAWHSKHAHAQLRMPGLRGARFNIVPVEYVADGIVALAEAPEARGGSFHLVADAPTQDEWFSALAERLGMPGLRVVTPRRGTMRQPTRLESRVHGMLGRYLDYLAHDATFDSTEADRVLAPRGIHQPVLRGRGLVEFIDRALGV